jgi:ParB/RepB/Spo0J family partition protein
MAPPKKFTADQESEIRRRAEAGESQNALAREFSTTQSMISKIIAAAKQQTAPGPQADIRLLQRDQLVFSPLNPRKSFDLGEIEELAESIFVRGLLQNIVARPRPDGMFEIMAGERRIRAIDALIRDFRWHRPGIPCHVIEADDGEHLAISLMENLHRQDVKPLEEAEAFVALQASNPTRWTAQEIAEKIGRTPRFVYQRIALATKLIPDAKQWLQDGRITIEAARLMAAEDIETQEHIVEQEMDDIENDDDHIILPWMCKNHVDWHKRQQKYKAERQTAMAESSKKSDDKPDDDKLDEALDHVEQAIERQNPDPPAKPAVKPAPPPLKAPAPTSPFDEQLADPILEAAAQVFCIWQTDQIRWVRKSVSQHHVDARAAMKLAAETIDALRAQGVEI